MTVQDLYRVLLDENEVEIKLKNGVCLWYGENEDIPIEYFDYIIDSIYSLADDFGGSYIVINFA